MTDPSERVVILEPDPRPPTTIVVDRPRTARPSLPPQLPESRRTSPVPTHHERLQDRRPGNRLQLAPSLPAMIAPDSLPPIFDEDLASSCRAAVDTSYSGVSTGIRSAVRPWGADGPLRRRYVQTGELMPAAPELERAAEPTPTPLDPDDPDAGDDDEMSTGVFEPGEDPYSRYASRSAPPPPEPDVFLDDLDVAVDPEPSRPSLALVRSVSDSVEEDFGGMRAAPLQTEPRPGSDEIVDWPPPMTRPGIDYPDDWSAADMGNTLIVIDPIRYGQRSRLVVVLLDIAAWVLGFVAMFLTGLVTTGSAALVFFALSL